MLISTSIGKKEEICEAGAVFFFKKITDNDFFFFMLYFWSVNE